MFIPKPGISRAECGLSLVELIVSMVVVSVGVAGILLALDTSVRGSVNPIVQKQALAIAEALLEEIQLMPFTYCDPDDAVAETAEDTGDCGVAEAIGPEAGEARNPGILQTPFDNVNDYQGFQLLSGIIDMTDAAIPGLEAYQATVTVAQQGIPAIITPAVPAIPPDEALLITVTVTGPGNASVRLDGYRTRYVPNLLP